MSYFAGNYDIAVIGAGHAGIEAGLAAARLGLQAVVFTINLDAVGNMPCNPAIGGTGKGHLVRELDALGGEMGRAADACCIQYRMLNRGKGPAVHSLRAQADRRRYQEHMKRLLEREPNLYLKQAAVTEIRTEGGHVSGVVTQLGAEYRVRAVIVAAGTYLDSTVITGQCVLHSGPDGHAAPRRSFEPVPARPGPAHAPVQDRHAARGSTRAASISPKWSCSAATTTRSRSRFPPVSRPKNQRRVLPDLHQRAHPRRHPRESAPQPAVRRRHRPASARATARASRTKIVRFAGQAAPPALYGAHAAWTRRSCICRACPPACRRRCSLPCCTPSRGWSTPR